MLIFEKDFACVSQFKILNVLFKMSQKINKNYICDLLINDKNFIILYSFDTSYIDINNCPCALIYNVEPNNNKLNVFIMYVATKHVFKGCGYATIFIKEFLEYINKKFFHKYDNINIILDSIIDSVTFYEQLGFKWITTNQYNDSLHILEEDYIEHFIMIYNLK